MAHIPVIATFGKHFYRNPILWVNSSLLLPSIPSQNLSDISMFPWLSHVKPPIVGVTWNSAPRHAFFEDGRTEPGAVDADASSAGVREHGLRLCRGTWNDDPGSDSLIACRMVLVEFTWTETPQKSCWNLYLIGFINQRSHDCGGTTLWGNIPLKCHWKYGENGASPVDLGVPSADDLDGKHALGLSTWDGNIMGI